ncbi:MAG: hypothetical protein IXK25_02945 [Candidatus Kinetoplastibacterium crithidii]|nr:hypothetical protein [Candidatus Kinetoplastibacterium crithidii]
MALPRSPLLLYIITTDKRVEGQKNPDVIKPKAKRMYTIFTIILGFEKKPEDEESEKLTVLSP